MSLLLCNNPSLRTGDVGLHIVSANFTRRDIVGQLNGFFPSTSNNVASAGGGFSRNTVNSSLDVLLKMDCGDSMLDLTRICDAVITITLPNRRAYTMSRAWFATTGTLGITSTSGQLAVRFESEFDMVEIVPPCAA